VGRRHQLIGPVSPNVNAARQSPIIIWRTEKRRNVLLIFADIARLNIAWPSIVQHLASFHPAVIHHNSTASISSRHVITLRPYLFCVSLLLSYL
jgi:hypothetical protein